MAFFCYPVACFLSALAFSVWSWLLKTGKHLVIGLLHRLSHVFLFYRQQGLSAAMFGMNYFSGGFHATRLLFRKLNREPSLSPRKAGLSRRQIMIRVLPMACGRNEIRTVF